MIHRTSVLLGMLAAAVLAAATPTARADTIRSITLLPTADTHVATDRWNGPTSVANPRFYLLFVAGNAFRTEKRSLILFDLSSLTFSADDVVAAQLRLYRTPGIPGGRARIRVHPLSNYWLAEQTTWNGQPGVNLDHPRSPTLNTIRAPQEGTYFDWDVKEIVRHWLRGNANHGFSVSGTLADQEDENFSIPFESMDSTDPESHRGLLTSGHPPLLIIRYKESPANFARPAPATISIPASPTPTPTAVPKPLKTTKGAATERALPRAAPWWMSDFLARLLGYEYAGTRPTFSPSL